MAEAQEPAGLSYYQKNKAAVLAQKKIYYQDKKEERIAYQLEWNRNHPQEKRANNRKWEVSHPEESRSRVRNRSARKRNALGSHTAKEVENLAVKQNHKCANPACKISIRKSYHVDHIVSLAKGGTNFIRNIQLLCPPCNRRKAAKDPIDWARENGVLL